MANQGFVTLVTMTYIDVLDFFSGNMIDSGSGTHDIGCVPCFPLRSNSGNMDSTVKQVAGCDIHTEHSPILSPFPDRVAKAASPSIQHCRQWMPRM